MRDLALPSSIGLFFQTMYNVVDSFYAGEISTAALAALGLSFPVFLLIIATSGGLSRGASALIANAIGSQEEDKQRRYIAQSISLGLVVSMVMTVTGIFVAKPLFELLGGTGECLEMAMGYMIPIFIGSVFFIISIAQKSNCGYNELIFAISRSLNTLATMDAAEIQATF